MVLKASDVRMHLEGIASSHRLVERIPQNTKLLPSSTFSKGFHLVRAQSLPLESVTFAFVSLPFDKV